VTTGVYFESGGGGGQVETGEKAAGRHKKRLGGLQKTSKTMDNQGDHDQEKSRVGARGSSLYEPQGSEPQQFCLKRQREMNDDCRETSREGCGKILRIAGQRVGGKGEINKRRI